MTTTPASTRPLVWTLALLCTVSYGALYYAQPLLAVATEHATGWTRVQTGLAFTAGLLVSAVLAPGVGRHLDRRGGHHLLSGGAEDLTVEIAPELIAALQQQADACSLSLEA